MYICHHEQTLFEMMKFRAKLLSVALLLLATLYTNAQVTPQNGQAWWGMWNSDMGLTSVGSFEKGTNTCAIRLLATNLEQLKDCQVHGLRFYISDKKNKGQPVRCIVGVDTEGGGGGKTHIPQIGIVPLCSQLKACLGRLVESGCYVGINAIMIITLGARPAVGIKFRTTVEGVQGVTRSSRSDKTIAFFS